MKNHHKESHFEAMEELWKVMTVGDSAGIHV
jgi:hypothetical protein